MVRLRRELEGIRRRFEVPAPSYALDPHASAALLPGLEAWLRDREPGRLLMAGVPRPALARTLAAAGHWVTVCDLTAEQVTELHGTLTPREAERLTLVDKGYGEASFGASSFDHIWLADSAHQYAEPRWLFQKAARELKPDAWLAARLLVQGPVGGLPKAEAASSAGQAWALRLARTTLTRLGATLLTPIAPALAGQAAVEAVDRGAHLRASAFAPDARTALGELGQSLRIEQVLVGHTLRLALADLAWDLRAPAHRLALAALGQVPERATAADLRSTAPRVLGVLARRALG
jgi:SAM-dependent methyltransferase